MNKSNASLYSLINYGDPDVERFWDKVEVDPITKCWNWKGFCASHNGYGKFQYKKHALQAHRFAYEVNKGKIPKGLELDHLCRNRKCVNPDHLEAVTQKENTRRSNNFIGINMRKTHCPKGHELISENLNKFFLKINQRVCNQCKNEYSYNWKRRNRLIRKIIMQEFMILCT